MVERDRSCNYPLCIRPARRTCSECHSWLCITHLAKHSCKRVTEWQAASPSMNYFGSAAEIKRTKKGARIEVKDPYADLESFADAMKPLPDMEKMGEGPGPRKPSHKAWRSVIPK